MPKLSTTVGRLLVDSVLPEDLRRPDRVLDKRGLSELLREVGEKYPDQYRAISHKLSQLGHQAAYRTGGNSFGLEAMSTAQSALRHREQLASELQQIIDNDFSPTGESLTDDQRDEQIIKAVGQHSTPQEEEIYQESLDEKNPIALQLQGAGRGSPMNLASLRGSDLLYTDHRGRVIAVPVTKSYAEGLDPAAYWAGAYGARKGVFDTKFQTMAAGFLSKQLNQIAHRLVVTADDDDDRPDMPLRGLPVRTDDDDSEGALLARETAGYPRNTVLTPKILHDLRRRGIDRLLVRSPVVSGTPDGGVYSRDVGVRERGHLPLLGENVGLAAAQALSEPISQGMLSSKHSGGVASANPGAVSGFQSINQQIQAPKTFKGGAAHSETDGRVQLIEEAPAGGHFVHINSTKHYVGKGYGLKVKQGDVVEAGDVLSDGIPNPSLIVQHKGVGEGRRYFVDSFRQAFRDAGIRVNRRNVELLSRGLINHVRLTDEFNGGIPDDIVPYGSIEHGYEPREGTRRLPTAGAAGKYLEKPYLHYTIGTKLRPSVIKQLKEFDVGEVEAHDEPPPFEPEMIRGMQNLSHDPDWVVRMMGSNLKGSLLKGVHRGSSSDLKGTSYAPPLAKAVDFGQGGPVRTPQLPKMPSVLAPKPKGVLL